MVFPCADTRSNRADPSIGAGQAIPVGATAAVEARQPDEQPDVSALFAQHASSTGVLTAAQSVSPDPA